MNDIFFNQKKCFQKATIKHATRSISYAPSRRPTSANLSLSLSLSPSLSLATNKQTNKTTKTTKQQRFVVPISFFFWVLGYTK